MVSSWLTTGLIAFQNNHIPNTDDPLALFDKIYDKPWTRLGPYMIGMCVGWFLFKTNCKIRMSRVSLIIESIQIFSFSRSSNMIFLLIFLISISYLKDHINIWMELSKFLFTLVDLWIV